MGRSFGFFGVWGIAVTSELDGDVKIAIQLGTVAGKFRQIPWYIRPAMGGRMD